MNTTHIQGAYTPISENASVLKVKADNPTINEVLHTSRNIALPETLEVPENWQENLYLTKIKFKDEKGNDNERTLPAVKCTTNSKDFYLRASHITAVASAEQGKLSQTNAVNRFTEMNGQIASTLTPAEIFSLVAGKTYKKVNIPAFSRNWNKDETDPEAYRPINFATYQVIEEKKQSKKK